MEAMLGPGGTVPPSAPPPFLSNLPPRCLPALVLREAGREEETGGEGERPWLGGERQFLTIYLKIVRDLLSN